MRSRPVVALVVGCSIIGGYGRQAVHTEPVSLHAANAAEAADVAQQAAKVAKRVAAHTEEVAHDTATALRYTQDALKRAGANSEDIEEVGKEAEKLEEEAGIEKGEAGSHRGDRQYQEISSRGGSRSQGGRSSGGNGHGSDGSSYGSSSSGGDGSPSMDVNAEISSDPGGAEPFGQEEPAKKLTEESVKQSDGMVKQIETAQGVEAKRSVYRALTKLRGATIASYDGMAKAHLKNVDNYNKKHKWREEHPFRHLADEEADTHIWAFPKKSSKKSAGPKHILPKKGKTTAPTGIASAPAPAPAA